MRILIIIILIPVAAVAIVATLEMIASALVAIADGITERRRNK